MAMGDIAFNLLIFFVILARAQDDSHLQWQPAVTPKSEASGNAKASIVINNESRLFLDGQEIAAASLVAALSERLGDAGAGDRVVLLKVDKDVLAQRYEPVIEAVSEAGGDLFFVLEEKRP